VALPESLFVKAIEMTGLDQIILILQQQQAIIPTKGMDEHNLHQDKAGRYYKGVALIIPEDKKLR
jgi:hypothetical protein